MRPEWAFSVDLELMSFFVSLLFQRLLVVLVDYIMAWSASFTCLLSTNTSADSDLLTYGLDESTQPGQES